MAAPGNQECKLLCSGLCSVACGVHVLWEIFCQASAVCFPGFIPWLTWAGNSPGTLETTPSLYFKSLALGLSDPRQILVSSQDV